MRGIVHSLPYESGNMQFSVGLIILSLQLSNMDFLKQFVVKLILLVMQTYRKMTIKQTVMSGEDGITF